MTTDPAPSPSRRRLLLLLAPFVVVIAGLVGVQLVQDRYVARAPISSIPDIPTPTPGPAPQLALPRLGGPDAVTLAAWRGKGIILNFWATWCYPCRQEMPLLADIHRANSERVEVVAVNEQEDPETARAFVEEFALPFPILLDEQGKLGDAFGIRGMPTTYFINPSGEVVGMHIGPLTAELLALWIERLAPPP